MKKGFSILELLVASLLLGMLITILTMVFNQSSIAWRTGVATVADLDQVRDNVGTAREEADDIYIWRDDALKLLSLWDEKGDLRARAVSVDDEAAWRAEHGDLLPLKILEGVDGEVTGQWTFALPECAGTGHWKVRRRRTETGSAYFLDWTDAGLLFIVR